MKQYRLDKRCIIKSSEKFNQLFQEGTKLSSRHFLILHKRSDMFGVGFTVSRKIRGAVKRNRAKRRLRELFRLNQSMISGDKEIILFAKPGVECEKYEALRTEFVELLERLERKK